MYSTGLLLAFLATAAYTDVVRHRIPNVITYSGIVGGLLTRTLEQGSSGFEDAVKGGLACGGIMLVCFVLFNIGGGDVKLLAMMGTALGLHDGIEALLWTFTLGFVLGVAVLIWQLGALRILARTFTHLRKMLMARGWLPLTEEQRRPLQRWLGLAPAALAATVIVRWEELVRLLPPAGS